MCRRARLWDNNRAELQTVQINRLCRSLSNMGFIKSILDGFFLFTVFSAPLSSNRNCSNLAVQRDYRSKEEICVDTIASPLYASAGMKRSRFICCELTKPGNNGCHSGVRLLFVHLHDRLNYF